MTDSNSENEKLNEEIMKWLVDALIDAEFEEQTREFEKLRDSVIKDALNKARQQGIEIGEYREAQRCAFECPEKEKEAEQRGRNEEREKIIGIIQKSGSKQANSNMAFSRKMILDMLTDLIKEINQ